MRFVKNTIDAVDPSQPSGYSPAGTLNATARRRQLAAIDADVVCLQEVEVAQ